MTAAECSFVYVALSPEKGPMCWWGHWFYLALCCVQRVVEAAEGCGEETVMWTDRLDDFHLKTFYLCCLHLRQPPEAESKSIIKSVPRWFQSFKPAQTVCFVVNNKPRLLPALCSLWVQRGSRVPLCRFRRAFPRRGAARRRCCCCCCFTAVSVAR